MKKEINFFNDKTFIGEFNLFKDTYSGKLVYKSGNSFELTIYDGPAIFLKTFVSDTMQKTDEKLDKITGIIYDENDIRYYVTLFNCLCLKSPIVGYGCTKFIFSYALFSESNEYKEIKDFTLDLYFNTWNEFCFPQGFKSLITVSNAPTVEIKLKNKLKIKFNEDLKAELINNTDLFSNLFVSCGNECLSKDEILDLNSKLQELIEPYKTKLYKKRDETHRWYLSIQNVSNINAISGIIWKLESLISLLTYDFTTDIDMVKIRTKSKEQNKSNELFYYLCKINKHKKSSKYMNQLSAFNCKNFTTNEWKIIFNNLFSQNKKNWLVYFIYVLLENNSDKPLTLFHITRYIDYIGAIGAAKGYNKKQKYENVILNFIDNLDVDLKRKILNVFRENLSIIKIKDNTQRLRNWKLIGKKLSEFRAYSAHIEQNKQVLPIYKAYEVYKILELIIIDYVFEILEIPDEKRLRYKTFYLKQISQLTSN